MEGKLLFVVNPVAGNIDKENLMRSIDQWLNNIGSETHFFKTTGKEDEESIKEQINDIQPKTVVAVGGDGTLKLCAKMLKNTEMQLGLIPAGSANGMATELQIPVNTRKALDIIEKGHTKTIDLLEFNGEELGMHISDIGINAGLIKKYEESSYRGFMGYAQGLFSKVQDFRSFKVEIEAGTDDYQSFNTYMVAFANAKRYGTGALLNTKGEIDDGKFEICIIKNLDILNITKHFFDQISEDDPLMHLIQCQKARIKIPGSKEPFQIDGEFKGEVSELTIKMLPQCLHMIVPH